jgi:RNA polymerase sigma factor (sigma-70 family)
MEFIKQIETLFRSGTAGGLTDGQLLERFLERRGEDAETAFAALVDRHGAKVLRLCRQVLNNEEDAEDAAQATFLVLARRAGSIGRRESIACWLHGVALRIAANIRVASTRRRARELRGVEMRTASNVVHADVGAIENHEDWATLHDELGSLPRTFREPLVLCYLDGMTQEQAAAQLRCPLGTIQSRLALAIQRRR